MLLLTTPIQYDTWNLNTVKKINKRYTFRKGINIGREVIILSLLAFDMIFYTENPKESTKNLLKLINDYSLIPKLKINMKKSITTLYTSNAQLEFEIKNKNVAEPCLSSLKYLVFGPGSKIALVLVELYLFHFSTLISQLTLCFTTIVPGFALGRILQAQCQKIGV